MDEPSCIMDESSCIMNEPCSGACPAALTRRTKVRSTYSPLCGAVGLMRLDSRSRNIPLLAVYDPESGPTRTIPPDPRVSATNFHARKLISHARILFPDAWKLFPPAWKLFAHAWKVIADAQKFFPDAWKVFPGASELVSHAWKRTADASNAGRYPADRKTAGQGPALLESTS